MHRRKADKGKLYFMIMRCFFVFVMAVILWILGIYALSNYLLDQADSYMRVQKILDQEELLKKEQFEKLNVRHILGPEGYLEVLDEQAGILYTSDQTRKNQYTIESLHYIPDAGQNDFFNIDQTTDAEGNTEYVLSRYTMKGQEEEVRVVLDEITVLDETYRVLYSNHDIGIQKLTEQEIESLLAGMEEPGFVQKYSYTTDAGAKRILMIHTGIKMNDMERLYSRMNTIVMIGILVGILLLMLLMAFYLSFLIRKPISVLNSAMEKMAEGNRGELIEYRGPSELVHVMDTFNSMTRQLRDGEQRQHQLEQEKNKMLADISHDLRTPITIIQGYADAVADGYVPMEDEKKYLRIISSKSALLAELINTFYEYSRLEHPAFRLQKEKGNLTEYFRKYMAAKYEELELMGYHLQVDIPEARAEIEFDHAQMRRIFENLIANTIKYNPPGVTVYAAMTIRKNIEIWIGDDGIGIPQELYTTVFSPFVVGEEARTSGNGTGLGLSIAQKIVQAHGGRIYLAKSKNDRWSTLFCIEIPGAWGADGDGLYKI